MTLQIAEDFALPMDAVTTTLAILGIRGSGKTYAGGVVTEEMLKVGMQVAVIDPLDVFWGLRSSADGDGAGLPIVIAGGDHGDIPLHAGSGEAMADAIVELGISVVLSLRHLPKTKQRTFVAEFAERLYHRKGESQHRAPLHVVIDEADAFVPQHVMGDSARVKGAIDDLVRRGRSSGIGVTLITQRPAVLHKDVLSQAEVLMAFRLPGPQDQKALDTWIQAHDTENRRAEFMATLASLTRGTCWLWSPGWLDAFRQVKIRRRDTFDSSATPKAGDIVIEPRATAEVDLDALRDRLARGEVRVVAATASADDRLPKELIALRQRVEDLERQSQDLRQELSLAHGFLLETAEFATTRATLIAHGHAAMPDVRQPDAEVQTPAALPTFPAAPSAPTRTVRTPLATTPASDDLKPSAVRLLDVLTHVHPHLMTRDHMADLARVSVTSSTFSSNMSQLKRLGYISESGDRVVPAMDVIPGALHSCESPPRTAHHWADLFRPVLKPGAVRMLDIMLGRSEWDPAPLSRESLAMQAGMSVTSSSFSSHLATLKRYELVTVDGQGVSPGPRLTGG